MTDYFGLTAGEVVKKIAIVFRSGEYYPTSGKAYLEGKDTGSKDIFIIVGFAINFITPSADGTSTVATKLPVKVAASQSSALNIKVNGTSIATRADSTSLTTSYTFANTGDFQFIASATANSVTVYDTLNICVPNSVTTATIDPASSQLGINYIDNNTVTLVFNAPNKTSVILIGDMKIGDVEFQGDGNKAIFYYIADERVDFRQLIKVFAETFRVRIEMKQIGARQEAGRIGGIGPCGRELCCSGWMSNFNSVSTAAARYQDLSLNPQKLAGQCGKLKCCMLNSYKITDGASLQGKLNTIEVKQLDLVPGALRIQSNVKGSVSLKIDDLKF